MENELGAALHQMASEVTSEQEAPGQEVDDRQQCMLREHYLLVLKKCEGRWHQLSTASLRKIVHVIVGKGTYPPEYAFYEDEWP